MSLPISGSNAIAVAYYDSCVFLNGKNASVSEGPACAAALDPAIIQWQVVFSDVSLLDSVPDELLNAFEVACVRGGISALRVRLSHVGEMQRTLKALKRPFLIAGLKGRDWKHLMAAVHGTSQWFLSTDRDFWDPASKRSRHHPIDGPVRRQIRQKLSITVELPSRALEEFGVKLPHR